MNESIKVGWVVSEALTVLRKVQTTAKIVCTTLHLNCTMIPYVGTEYGDCLDNGTCTGMIGMVQRGEVDTFDPYLTPMYTRYRQVDFTEAFFNVDVILVTRAPVPRVDRINLDVAMSFSWKVWVAFVSALFLTAAFISWFTGIVLRMIERIERPTDEHEVNDAKCHVDPMSFLISIVYHWPSLITHKHDEGYMVMDFVKVTITFWSLAALVISSSYTGVLFSEKLKKTDNVPFKDMDTFVLCMQQARCRIIIQTLSISYMRDFLAPDNMYGKPIWATFDERPVVIETNLSKIPDTILQHQSNDEYLVWIGDMATFEVRFPGGMDDKEGRLCPFYVIEAAYKEKWSFPLRKNSTLKRRMDKMAAVFTEQGLAEGLGKKEEVSRAPCDQNYFSSDYQMDGSATANAALLFLAGGIVGGLLLFGLELGWRKRREEGRE